MVFVKGDTDTGIGKAVFSTRNKRVVYVAEPNLSESVDITLTSTICAFTVTRTKLTATEDILLYVDAYYTNVKVSGNSTFVLPPFAVDKKPVIIMPGVRRLTQTLLLVNSALSFAKACVKCVIALLLVP